jgi:hypothetical protein
MEAGRNDPCPCGSGKKFKHCHGGSNQAQASPQETAWRRVRRVLEGYPTMMLHFVGQVYGSDAIDEAWDEFTLWSSDEPHFDPATPHVEVFLPWFYHQWTPDTPDTSIEDEALYGRSPTSLLLERRGGRLDPVLRRYLEACLDAPFSFHEVLRCDPGRALRTRDLFTGMEHEVLDRSASRTLRAGDTFFGQLVSSEGVTLIEACGPHAIPPREKLGLIDFREHVTRGYPFPTELLRDWAEEIREKYVTLADHLLNPPAPRLQTTDGEEIVFHRLFFEIDSPRRALDALKHLALDQTDDELLEEAELDSDGEVRRVAFAWKVAGNAVHRSWDNTVHGHIEIDGGELRAEVHSTERAARLRGMLEELLGEGIRHVRTETESVEEAMSARRASPPASATSERPSWADHPEVLEKIRELTAAHYESWVTDEIPALGGLTPLEAVRDRIGREKVEILISDMERSGPEAEPPIDVGVFARMRERLGLARDPQREG